MSEDNARAPKEPPVRTAVEIAIRLGVIALLVVACLQIVAPFVGIVAWGMIIAVAAGSPFEALCRFMGGRRGLAATVAVVLALLVIFVPAVLLTNTLVSGARHYASQLADGSFRVPPPAASVADWPLIGHRVHDAWMLASENLDQAVERAAPQLETVSRGLLRAAGSAGAGVLELIASVLIAGVLLAYSPGRHEAIVQLATRLAGERGRELADLASATIQSVVQGILGVALIQAVLAGLGLIIAGIPGAGLWALLVLVAAVVQLPVGLALLPPVAIGFSTLGTAPAIAFTVWCVIIALLDNVLKPLLFGRGVNVPTVVIFLGAIGGMLSMGIIGLFLGAVVLALGYALFMAWLSLPDSESEGAPATSPRTP
jgi:predicted PurR-regulated permease PerM